ncbi:hypothetical protein LTR56_004735 [Elasticomyces elasticus]|nr:hypothetical protein LTR56_004735 [Elasticomyces elasticus]KAK3665590.1 hypothetical protein LTR22_003530 [Elasticomyces elasticus]KAK5768901.1 hypothetical protein LTS12_000961 [Elasticomyces elasticus]
MSLINTETQLLEYHVRDDEHPYAILSHTWEDQEVSHQELLNSPESARTKAGYTKIAYTCKQARANGLDYAWVDTVCIDKASSAELSQSINSMYRYYHDAVVCYVYMADVSGDAQRLDERLWTDNALRKELDGSDWTPWGVRHNHFLAFKASRWFTRGWTLQELLAPRQVEFVGKAWNYLGSLESLVIPVSDVTGIDIRMLTYKAQLSDFPIATRMSWAANRQTSRPEDRAYSLLGIFDINMPMLYGEGDKAFVRLQEEIIRVSTDLSIFIWDDLNKLGANGLLFAPSPDHFVNGREVIRDVSWERSSPHGMTNRGLQISVVHPATRTSPFKKLFKSSSRTAEDKSLAVLPFRYRFNLDRTIALRLRVRPFDGDHLVDEPRLTTVPVVRVSEARPVTISKGIYSGPFRGLPKLVVHLATAATGCSITGASPSAQYRDTVFRPPPETADFIAALVFRVQID